MKPNSIKTYFSNLRALYNEATREGLLPHHAENPFRQISLRKEPGIPRAVGNEVIDRLAAIRPEASNLRRAADFCIFCFLACDTPFVDLAHLTLQNIRGGELVYNRHKTGTPIRIGITPGIQTLIDKYHLPGSPYLFPILKEQTRHEAYKLLLRTYNKDLNEIGKTYLMLDRKLTSCVTLGHTSEKTTRLYLASLDQSEIDVGVLPENASNILINYKKNT